MPIPTILIIDDDKVNIELIKNALTQQGFNVIIGATGQDLIDLAEQKTPNLIIADVKIPIINGIEAVKQVYARLKEIEAKPIPVIFMTAYDNAEMRDKAAEINPIDYLQKPFEITALLRKTKMALHMY